MLHKTENMITADCLLRMLRLERRIKHVEGIVMPSIDGDKQGYRIKITTSNMDYFYNFLVDSSGYIYVYIDNNTLELLDNAFTSVKAFPAEGIASVKEYLVAAIVNAIRATNSSISVNSKYKAL